MHLLTNLLLVTLLGTALTLPSSFDSAAVCNTQECQQVAKYIGANIDENADPCDDFYKFACGKFKDSHPLPGSAQNIDGLTLVQQELTARQIGLLDNPTLKNHGSKIIRKAKQMYDDCRANIANVRPTTPETGRFMVKESDSLVPEGMYENKTFSMSPEDVCRREVQSEYPLVITRLYLDKYFPIAEHNATRNTIMNVWKAFRNDIVKSIPWIDGNTRKNVYNNLDRLEVNTGYPDWLSNDKELDREYQGRRHPAWPMDPLTVNAHFYSVIPEITIPAGILHRQIFNRNYPNYINYGAGAYISGHEISHGVDYWTRNNRGNGKDKANDCIINQAETIKEPQTGLTYSDGSSILSEMLADIGGINASYTAYKKNTQGQEQQLPGLTKYTADQLFFLAQANTWCANSVDSYIKFFMSAFGHPYNYYRVSVTALNSPVFAKAFNCKAGTRMNPRNKCILW